MDVSETEFIRLISNLRSEVFDQRTAGLLRSLASSAEGIKRLVNALLAAESELGRVDEKSVYDAMHVLEQLADKYTVLACTFMAYLALVAGDLMMHDVNDSIRLWTDRYKSAELKHNVLMLADSQNDEGSRRCLEQLVE